MRQLDILCDLDGIVVDLHGSWLAWYNEKFNDTLTKAGIHNYYMADVVKLEAQKHIHDFLNIPNVYANLPPHPGACEALRLFHDQGHHIAIASMPVQRPASTTEKLTWCRQHLPWLKKNPYCGIFQSLLKVLPRAERLRIGIRAVRDLLYLDHSSAVCIVAARVIAGGEYVTAAAHVGS